MQINPVSPTTFLPQPARSSPLASEPAVQADKESSVKTAPARQGNSQELGDEQRAQVAKLQSRDREVRAHESAHLAAAGGLARGGANFSYTVGPDNRRYAVGGEVSIDTSPADSPEKTIQKAQTIQAAALAPAKPSSQDSAVAASAAKMAAQARSEISTARAQESKDTSTIRQSDAVKSYSSTAGFGDEKDADSNTINVIV